MKKLEAIIRRSKLEDVRCALAAWGVSAVTLTDVHGIGRERPRNQTYRGIEHNDISIPRVKLEAVIEDDTLEDAIEAILVAAFTGKVGDGKIFVSDVQSMIHIRTGQQHSDHALESCG